MESQNKGHIGTALGPSFFVLLREVVHFLEVTKVCKTSIWDYEKCPLDGGEFYCVLYRECMSRFYCIHVLGCEPDETRKGVL